MTHLKLTDIMDYNDQRVTQALKDLKILRMIKIIPKNCLQSEMSTTNKLNEKI
jgi:hypothetical protein